MPWTHLKWRGWCFCKWYLLFGEEWGIMWKVGDGIFILMWILNILAPRPHSNHQLWHFECEMIVLPETRLEKHQKENLSFDWYSIHATNLCSKRKKSVKYEEGLGLKNLIKILFNKYLCNPWLPKHERKYEYAVGLLWGEQYIGLIFSSLIIPLCLW